MMGPTAVRKALRKMDGKSARRENNIVTDRKKIKTSRQIARKNKKILFNYLNT